MQRRTRLTTDNEKIDAAIAAYLKTYEEIELVQEAASGDTDPQLSTIALSLGTDVAASQTGALIDIGCGAGALLKRTAQILNDNAGWQYIAVEVEDRLDEVSRLARTLKLYTRTHLVTVPEFGTDPIKHPGRKLYVCRNVLHELRLDQATQLIGAVCRDFASDDVLIIQDLYRFPQSERHHHAWIPTLLCEALKSIGFGQVIMDSQASRSGNQWFNLRASRLVGCSDTASIREALLRARREQWDIWARLVAPEDNQPKRPGPIDAVDLDLQFASLTRELRDEGLSVHLDPDTQKRLRVTELIRRIEDIADGPAPAGAPVQTPDHFRERGQQLTHAEEFLRSMSRLALVYGGPGTGKTTFIDQLLANRLYDKTLVRIDFRTARGIWPVVERILAQLGVNLAAEVIGVLDGLAYNQIQAAMGRVLNKYAGKMIFVFENVDDALDSNLRFSDPQVRELLVQVAGKSGAKMLLSARRDFLPADLVRAAGNDLPITVRMGRYGADETVINILDDYFDRAGAGLERYPSTLIAAIDRHPLVASLAGRILASEGRSVLRDEAFFRELRQKLRSELLARLVDDSSRLAVEAAGELRVPVPAVLLERLASRESVHQARGSDVLYAMPDRRWGEILQSLGLFKKRYLTDASIGSDDPKDRDTTDHGRIADAYLQIYRTDDDPTWMRESHYHRMLSGDPSALKGGAGAYYRTELIASAAYCFDRRRDYRLALDLYDAAAQIGPLDEAAAMWRASCLIRLGETEEGNQAYQQLVAEYPENIGLRRSHVDALLSVEDFETARDRLTAYDLKQSANDWHAQQWGRVELGLHHYEAAIAIFSALASKNVDDPFVVTYLARALQQFGDLTGAIKTLERGHEAFPHNVAIATSLGANLERNRQDAKARDLLEPLFDANHGNARAALALVRIHRRENRLDLAARVVRQCENADLSRSMRMFLATAHAELLIARGQPGAAAEYIREHLAGDESPGLLIDALMEAADHAADADEKEALLREAASVVVPKQLVHNVPIQVTRAKLAIRIGNRAMFDSAVSNLAETRIDADELDRVRSSFG